MNETVTVVLRFIHIVAGVFWAGAVFLMVGFVFPSVRAAGPAGGRVMQEIQRRKLPVFMNTAAGLTMVSGFILYGRLIASTDGLWARSTSGMAFGVGAVAAILAAIVGGGIVGRSTERLGKLGEKVQASGGAPSPEQAAEMGRVQARIAKAARLMAGFLFIAVAAMATARYL